MWRQWKKSWFPGVFWTSCVSNLFTQEKPERRLDWSRNPYPGLHRQPLSKSLNFICALAIIPFLLLEWPATYWLGFVFAADSMTNLVGGGRRDYLLISSILFPSHASPYKHAPKSETVASARYSNTFRRKAYSNQWTRIAVQFHSNSFLPSQKPCWNLNPSCFGESNFQAASRLDPRAEEPLRGLMARLRHVQGVRHVLRGLLWVSWEFDRESENSSSNLEFYLLWQGRPVFITFCVRKQCGLAWLQ